MAPVVHFPVLALAAVAGSLALAFVLYRAVGRDYVRAVDEGGLVLNYVAAAERKVADAGMLIGEIEDGLKTTPEVVAFSRRMGTQLGFFLTESNKGDFSVRLRSNRTRDIYEVMDSVRGRILQSLPGVHIEFSQVLQDLIGDLSGTPQPIEVKVFGADQASIEAVAGQVASHMRAIPGLVDVFDGLVISNPQEA